MGCVKECTAPEYSFICRWVGWAWLPAGGRCPSIPTIPGGGLRENLERILPTGVRAVLDRDSWPVPPVFTWLQRLGEVDPAEMERVFNMGIGFALVVSPYYASSVSSQLADLGLENWPIGKIVPGERGVTWDG